MNHNETGRIREYRDSVCILSYDLALLALMAERVERGELTTAEVAETIVTEIETDKRHFLRARAALGLDAGREALAAFTEDHFFDGFSVQESRFEGDRQKAGKICEEWVREMTVPPSEEQATRYEYGTFILMLSGSAQMVFCRLAAGQETRHWFVRLFLELKQRIIGKKRADQ